MSVSEEKAKIRICRLCLAKTSTYFSLIDNVNATRMLKSLTSLEICLDDDISTVMCYKCRLNLKLAYNIQQNMLKVEERFQQLCTVPEEEKIVIVEEKPEYKCDICEKTFSIREKLSIHKSYCNKRKKCPICGKEITVSNLNNHVKIHQNTQVICELCGAKLKTAHNLKKHLRLSHQPAQCKCNYCDKAFKSNKAKTNHENKEHLGKADFMCDTCGKKFYSTWDLTKHINMKHLKLRPFVCDVCKNGFSSRYALVTHRRRHTNETPFKCDVCGEGYRQKVSLKSHLKSKHQIEEELTCFCEVCGKGFASKGALYTHQRTHD